MEVRFDGIVGRVVHDVHNLAHCVPERRTPFARSSAVRQTAFGAWYASVEMPRKHNHSSGANAKPKPVPSRATVKTVNVALAERGYDAFLV